MHTLKDDNNAANNQASTAVTVNDASNVIHIGNLDATTSSSGTRWSATVEITVHDANHDPLNGATVVGHWSQLGTNSNTCTTGDLALPNQSKGRSPHTPPRSWRGRAWSARLSACGTASPVSACFSPTRAPRLGGESRRSSTATR